MWLLFIMAAFAAEPTQEAVTGPVPEGTVVTVLDDTGNPVDVDVHVKSWLLRNDAYERALTTSLSFDAYKASLTECHQASLEAWQAASAATDTAKAQFEVDDAFIQQLTEDKMRLQLDLAREVEEKKRVRRQRNTAYAIVGATVAAVVGGAVLGVTISN